MKIFEVICTRNFVSLQKLCKLESSFSNILSKTSHENHMFFFTIFYVKIKFLPVSYTQNDNNIFEVVLTLWRHSEVIHWWLVLILVSMKRRCPYLYTGSKFTVIWPSVYLIIRRGLQQPHPLPFGKYVWENPQENKG